MDDATNLSIIQTTAHELVHAYLTDFVEDMATSLSAYASAEDYTNPFSFYEKLCWSGAMLNTPTFQSLYPPLFPSISVMASASIY